MLAVDLATAGKIKAIRIIKLRLAQAKYFRAERVLTASIEELKKTKTNQKHLQTKQVQEESLLRQRALQEQDLLILGALHLRHDAGALKMAEKVQYAFNDKKRAERQSAEAMSHMTKAELGQERSKQVWVLAKNEAARLGSVVQENAADELAGMTSVRAWPN
jgi:beta-lactamase superfamily II metal-dependent hydrolase